MPLFWAVYRCFGPFLAPVLELFWKIHISPSWDGVGLKTRYLGVSTPPELFRAIFFLRVRPLQPAHVPLRRQKSLNWELKLNTGIVSRSKCVITWCSSKVSHTIYNSFPAPTSGFSWLGIAFWQKTNDCLQSLRINSTETDHNIIWHFRISMVKFRLIRISESISFLFWRMTQHSNLEIKSISSWWNDDCQIFDSGLQFSI